MSRQSNNQPRRLGGSFRLGLAGLLLAALAAGLAPFAAVPANGGQETDKVFEVNSSSLAGEDANKGDGICATSAGTCALWTAIQEANAWGKAHSDANILVTVAEDFTRGTVSLPGIYTETESEYLMVQRIVSEDKTSHGAVYSVETEMTIDLLGRLDFGNTYGASARAFIVFYIQASNVTIRNFGNIVSSSIGIGVGSETTGVVVERGTFEQLQTGAMREGVRVFDGAHNVTLQDLTMERVGTGTTDGVGGVVVRPLDMRTSGERREVVGLRIQRVLFDWHHGPAPFLTCSFSGGGYCGGPGVDLSSKLPVKDLTISECTFTGFDGTFKYDTYKNNHYAIPIFAKDSPALTNLRIVHNQFVDNYATHTFKGIGFVTLLDSRILGDSTIAGNTFENLVADGKHSGASIVYSQGGTVSGQSDALVIEDNYFNAEFTGKENDPPVRSVIQHGLDGANQDTTATIRRNSFGPKSVSQTNPAEAEETYVVKASFLVANGKSYANHQVRTWVPSQPLASKTACEATLTVSPPDGGTQPTLPVEIDVYYTPGHAAEVYLGTQEITSNEPTEITVPYHAASNGFLRVQTQGSTSTPGVFESSQFSRTVGIPKAPSGCLPPVNISRAKDQPAQTMRRNIRFLVSAQVPINDVGPNKVGLSSSTAPGAAVVSTSRLTARQILVNVRVNDSGRAVADLIGTITAAAGGAMEVHARDNWVDFQNPLSLAPSQIEVEDHPVTSEQYSILSAIPPVGAVTITPTVTGDVTVDQPILLGAAMSTTATVTAVADNTRAGNRSATIAHTVSSSDPDFDGLFLPSASVTILDTDPPPPEPGVRIVKRAWLWEGTQNPTYAQLLATGQAGESASGSLHPVGATIWWTYEVINVGETPLTDLTVEDPELGVPNDLVCEIPSLAINASHGCVGSGQLFDQSPPSDGSSSPAA
ncbi:MAG: hypothetical protein LBH48_03675 [Bifidobacteriaceae bacterium]|nr:hypothetical protein [Bifidobacteriaceae bacterium]